MYRYYVPVKLFLFSKGKEAMEAAISGFMYYYYDSSNVSVMLHNAWNYSCMQSTPFLWLILFLTGKEAS